MTQVKFEQLQAVVFGMMQLARDMETEQGDTEFSQRLAKMTAAAGVLLFVAQEKTNG